MSVVYIGKMFTPKFEVDKVPPSVALSSWFSNIIATVQAEGEFKAGWEDGYIKMTFNSKPDLENWLRTHALSDPALLNDIKVWNATYGVTHSNEIHYDDGTIESTTLSLIPLE